MLPQFCLLLLASGKFDPRVENWVAVSVPPEKPAGDRMVWQYATSYSKLEWQVARKGDRVEASLGSMPSVRPAFLKLDRNVFFEKVSDGWLVEFNHGEWGGKLYWFSPNGKEQHLISQDQVTAFFRRGNELFAVEGLAHLSLSSGSVIRIEPVKTAARWKTTQVATLPKAPYAVSVRSNGDAVITMSEGVTVFGADNQLRPFVVKAPWEGLYPSSSVLSKDERKLYIGMRQFVGELDLGTKKLRLLVPNRSFLNRLPKDEEASIRATYKR